MEKGEGMANLRCGRSGVTEKEAGGSTGCQENKVLTKELVCSNSWLLYRLAHSAHSVSILRDRGTALGPGPHLTLTMLPRDQSSVVGSQAPPAFQGFQMWPPPKPGSPGPPSPHHCLVPSGFPSQVAV